MNVYVYASLCDFVCIALLLPFVLGFCLSFFFFVYVLALVTIGGFVFWFGCSFFFLLLFKKFICNNIFLFFILFHFFFLFFSPFSSEPSG